MKPKTFAELEKLHDKLFKEFAVLGERLGNSLALCGRAGFGIVSHQPTLGFAGINDGCECLHGRNLNEAAIIGKRGNLAAGAGLHNRRIGHRRSFGIVQRRDRGLRLPCGPHSQVSYGVSAGRDDRHVQRIRLCARRNNARDSVAASAQNGKVAWRVRGQFGRA